MLYSGTSITLGFKWKGESDHGNLQIKKLFEEAVLKCWPSDRGPMSVNVNPTGRKLGEYIPRPYAPPSLWFLQVLPLGQKNQKGKRAHWCGPYKSATWGTEQSIEGWSKVLERQTGDSKPTIRYGWRWELGNEPREVRARKDLWALVWFWILSNGKWEVID